MVYCIPVGVPTFVVGGAKSAAYMPLSRCAAPGRGGRGEKHRVSRANPAPPGRKTTPTCSFSERMAYNTLRMLSALHKTLS